MRELMSKVNAATERNEMVNALKAFGAVATEKGIQALTAASAAAKKVLLAGLALMFLAGSAGAKDVGLSEFIASKAQEMKGVYSLTWPSDEPRHAGGAYVPINVLHSKDKEFYYFDWGIGVEEPEGSEKTGLMIPVMFNIVDVMKKAMCFQWAKDHVTTAKLPPIWLGPIWLPPTNLSKSGLKSYVFIDHLGIGISIRLGSVLSNTEESNP